MLFFPNVQLHSEQTVKNGFFFSFFSKTIEIAEQICKPTPQLSLSIQTFKFNFKSKEVPGTITKPRHQKMISWSSVLEKLKYTTFDFSGALMPLHLGKAAPVFKLQRPTLNLAHSASADTFIKVQTAENKT